MASQSAGWRVPEDLAVSARLAAHPPHGHHGNRAEGLSEGSTCGGGDKNAVTQAHIGALFSVVWGASQPGGGSCYLHFVGESLLTQGANTIRAEESKMGCTQAALGRRYGAHRAEDTG